MSNSADTRKSAIYIAQSLISGLFPILLYPVITENINPNIFGVFALTVVYASIVTGIANLGCIVGYERNFFLVENSRENSGKLLATTQLFVILSFSIVIALSIIFSETIAVVLFGDHSYTLLWSLVLVSTSISTFAQYYLTYLKNAGSAKVFFKLTVLQSIINFIIAWVLLENTDYGVYSLAYALLVSNLIIIIVAIIHQLLRLPLGFDKQLLREVLKVSLPLTPRVLFGFLNTQFDKIMLASLADMGNVGIYTIAQKIGSVIYVFMNALDRVFKPNVFRMLFSEERPEIIGKYLTPFVFVSLLPALMLILFSFEIVTLLLSAAYSGATDILVVLSVYYASLFIGKINGTQLIYAKKTWLTSKLTLLSVLLNVSLNVLFINLWGALGAALATTLSTILTTVVAHAYAQRYAEIRWEVRSVVLMYVVLLIAAFFIMGVEFSIINIDYVFLIGLKLFLVSIYMYVGIRAGIVRWRILKQLTQAFKTHPAK